MNNKELNPTEYFNQLKDKKTKITDKELLQLYNNCEKLIQKYMITGQTNGAKKVLFHLENIEKEREIVKMGIDTFIYRSDIEEYIEKVSNNVVKIIELHRYEREIPDEIVEVIAKVKDKFDQLYIVFTDYTGEVERQVEKERRDKDPILFGTFQDEKTNAIVERFYYLGDWEDEYCDLTLDKMVSEMKDNGKDIEIKISTPTNLEELKEQINKLESKNNSFIINPSVKPKNKEGVFKKVKTFLIGE
ncbi:hypothetical protein [Clostridium perfringens]|uniref:hypothetical protein n=1 Tax=Clostridium perfringens TaxID=1502 RepID=UPI0019CFE97F|nr:hypothetical protein [Clostridium perfringens]